MGETVLEGRMTGQIHFNSHVWVVTDVACRLVNALTGGHDGTRPVEPPPVGHRADAVRTVIERDDYRPALTEDQANALTTLAERVREVFTASSSGDVAGAACIVNDLLEEFGAAPRLDPARGGGWTLHFHGRDTSIVVGWAPASRPASRWPSVPTSQAALASARLTPATGCTSTPRTTSESGSAPGAARAGSRPPPTAPRARADDAGLTATVARLVVTRTTRRAPSPFTPKRSPMPGVLKAAPAAPPARRQRRAQP